MGSITVRSTRTGGLNYPLRSGSKDIRIAPASYTFSTSYTLGGEVCDIAGQFPGVARSIIGVAPCSTAGYTFSWLPTGRIVAYQNGAEVGAGTNLQSLIAQPVMMLVIARLRAR